MPLGEAAKGSGQCKEGSGVKLSAGSAYCAPGDCPECLIGSAKKVGDLCHTGGGGWDYDDV